ncbi:MAG: hypothetical protein B0W54_24085 [Cellvibrio sp. 79]|nr:MAG: hypothetical protein B0W54_24085 [Cellvibrio sp. 79]
MYSIPKKITSLHRVSIAVFLLLSSPTVSARDSGFINMLFHGGIAIPVILALSILALSVSIERLVRFREKFIVPPDLPERVRHLWQAGKYAEIHTLLAKENSTLARAIDFMVLHRAQSFVVVNNGVSDIASFEIRYHQQKAYALAIVATVAPIVGLLGTVLEMINAFEAIAFADGMENPVLLAGGISMALINTAAGLSVALPALGMHHFLKNRAAFLGLHLEKHINQLLNEWFMPAVTTAPHLRMVEHAH